MRYAENTTVSTEKSRNEIERTLRKYGACKFGYSWEELDGQEVAVIGFNMNDRTIRFELVMPSQNASDFTITPTGKKRSESQAYAIWEQATRQRWRALALVVKAKLEAVESEITTFEQEFLAHIVVPGTQKTIAQLICPQLEQTYKTGKPPLLLPAGRN